MTCRTVPDYKWPARLAAWWFAPIWWAGAIAFLLGRLLGRASGLELVGLQFIEERYFLKDPRKRMAHYINASPRQNFWFGPWYPLLSHVFLSAPKALERCGKPYLACVILRKPARNGSVD